MYEHTETCKNDLFSILTHKCSNQLGKVLIHKQLKPN